MTTIKKLHTAYGVFDTLADAQRAEFRHKVVQERKRQIDKGYTLEHDRKHGPRHLINWAIEYTRRGKWVEAAALMLALDDLLAEGEKQTKIHDLDPQCEILGLSSRSNSTYVCTFPPGHTGKHSWDRN